jgi:protein O-mannosyl-transferase
MTATAPKPARTVHPALGAALIVVVTLLAYLPALRAGFVWDDDVMLTANSVIRARDGLWSIWFTTRLPDYFPLTSSSLWLEWRLWDLHPAGYHIVNVLLHAFSSVVLWRVLRRLSIPGAWVAALVFALHPVNVESVAWVAERKNTLAIFFYLLALLTYLKFEHLSESGAEPSRARGPRICWYGLSLAMYLLALLSKTAVVPLPLVLLGCAWWQRRRIAASDLWRSVPFFAVALLLGLVTISFRCREVVNTYGFAARLAGAGWSVWFYLYKALWPVNLAFVYPRWEIDAHSRAAFLPFAGLALVLFLFWRGRRTWGRPGLFALAYYVLMLLPVLGFVNVYFMKYSLVADHWQYFSLIGIIALVIGLMRSRLPNRAFNGLAAALVLVLAPLTWRQAATYADEQTLWRATLANNPQAWLAHGVLGDLATSHGNFPEAAAHYAEVLRLRPGDATAHFKLGNVLAQQLKLAEAIEHYGAALQSKHDFPEVHYRLGLALLQQGHPLDAQLPLTAAVRYQPANVEARAALAHALAHGGRITEAIEEYRETLRHAPDWPSVLNNLAWILSAHPDATVRNGPEAVRLATRACALTGQTNISALGTLAAAYAEAGQFTNALTAALKADQLARAFGDTNLIRTTGARVESLRAGQPVRDP